MKILDINNLSDYELKELKKQINEKLKPKNKNTDLFNKNLISDGFKLLDDLPYELNRYSTEVSQKDREGVFIQNKITNPVFDLLDYTLGNYYFAGYTVRHTALIRKHSGININENLYEEMKNDLYNLILKYNKKALEEAQNDN